MEFFRTAIPGLVRFRAHPHRDQRGYFSRTFEADVARAAGVDPLAFVEDSQSQSAYGVIRGLHVRLGRGESKLVRCAHGVLFDVVVDLRPDSPAYRTWLSFTLDSHTQDSIFIPAGCAHGFQALAEPTLTAYRIDREHDPSQALSIAWDDPELAIGWPVGVTAMSEGDRTALPLAELEPALGRIDSSARPSTSAAGGPDG